MSNILLPAIMLILAALSFYPALVTQLFSFGGKTAACAGADLAGSIPVLGETGGYITAAIDLHHLSLHQYFTILIESTRFHTSFWKSCEYSLLIAAGQVIAGSMAAFAFSGFSFRGRNTLFFIFITAMMMPFHVTMVPNFITLKALGIMGKDAAIILPGIFSAFGVFLLRQFMTGIPDSVVEAAQIDGAGPFSIFFSIILPMSREGIAALLILSFIDTWNMVEQPLVFLSDIDRMPLSIIIREAINHAGEIVFAPSVLFMLPAILIFLIFEKPLIGGIEKGWGKA